MAHPICLQLFISSNMASLKQDLDEYLLLQSDQKKNFSAKIPQIKVPDLGKLFTRSEPTEPSNSWLQDTQDSCCPKLVNVNILINFYLIFDEFLFLL